MRLLAEPSLFEVEAPQFDPTKAQTKGKIFILDKDLTDLRRRQKQANHCC